MEKMKPGFRLGMMASDVLIEILRINPFVTAVLFKTYIPTRNLQEESVILSLVSVERLQRHSPTREGIFWLKREEITVGRLDAIAKSLVGERVLAVASKAKVSNFRKTFHIPMMDFNCEASPENLDKIQEFLEGISQEGVVLASGRSYHFYGIKLMTKDESSVFFGKCLLLSGYIDHRYIGHRLIDGFANLRISAEIRRPLIPKVVAILPGAVR